MMMMNSVLSMAHRTAPRLAPVHYKPLFGADKKNKTGKEKPVYSYKPTIGQRIKYFLLDMKDLAALGGTLLRGLKDMALNKAFGTPYPDYRTEEEKQADQANTDWRQKELDGLEAEMKALLPNLPESLQEMPALAEADKEII